MAVRNEITPITIVPGPVRPLSAEYATAKPIAIMIKKINTEKELLVFITISSNYLINYKSDVLPFVIYRICSELILHLRLIPKLSIKCSECNKIIWITFVRGEGYIKALAVNRNSTY
jgi:hypothetical protein